MAENILQTAPGEFETTAVITNELGLHARPAALVAELAQQYAAEAALIAGGKEADAKSILDILSLAAVRGTALTIRCKGRDAEDCITSIADLVRLQFRDRPA